MIHHRVVTTFLCWRIQNLGTYVVFQVVAVSRSSVEKFRLSSFEFWPALVWKYLQLCSFLLLYIRNSSMKSIVSFEKILFGCFFLFFFFPLFFFRIRNGTLHEGMWKRTMSFHSRYMAMRYIRLIFQALKRKTNGLHIQLKYSYTIECVTLPSQVSFWKDRTY